MTGIPAEFMLEIGPGAGTIPAYRSAKISKRIRNNMGNSQMKKTVFAAMLAASTMLASAAFAAEAESCKAVVVAGSPW